MHPQRFIPPAFDTVVPGAAAKPFTPKQFGTPKVDAPPPPPPPPTFSEAEMKTAEAAGYRKGYLEGEAQGKAIANTELAALDERLEALLAPLAAQMSTLFCAYNATVSEALATTPVLALTVAKKLAGEALKHDSLPFIEPLVTACVERVLGAPSIIITVHDTLAPRLEERLQQHFSNSQEPGDVVIHGDAGLASTDAIVAWGHGQASISQADRIAQLERVVEDIAAHRQHAYTPLSPPNQGDAT